MGSNFYARTAPNLSALVIALLCLVPSISALLPQSGNVLRVLVPQKTIFEALVECSDDGSYVKGFSIDVFKSALDILIPKHNWTDVTYKCYEIGDKTYDNLITALHTQPVDTVVGDITISASRLKNTSFTQSYLDSGIVIVSLAEGVSPSFGMFFAPFTRDAWVVIIVSIVSTGLAVWLIERNDPSDLQSIEARSEPLTEVFRHFWIKICRMNFQ